MRQRPPPTGSPPPAPAAMTRLGDLVDDAIADLPSELQAAARGARQSPRPSSPSSPSSTSTSSCPHCHGAGTALMGTAEATALRLIVIDRYANEQAVVICPHCPAGQQRAARWSGLPDEGRAIRLQALRQLGPQREAIRAVAGFVREPRGWLTLSGSYGVGKTTLIYAALNHLAEQGVYGRYLTAPELIDHLRDALRDQDGRAHSARLERMKTLPVLAVDELDKYYSTGYAEEAIFKLFEHRYRERATLATLIGYNRERDDRIPPFLASRIRDGRFRLIEIGGPDIRPTVTDEPALVWARDE